MAKRGPKPRAPLERIFPQLEWRGECLVWTGCTDPKGYGRVTVDGKTRLVHRVVWQEQVGPIDQYLLMHSCDNPSCCNLDHLNPGTIAHNTADMYAKGRERPPWRGVTECKRGHAFDGANTYITPDGRRQCRSCRAEATARYLSR